MAVLPQDASVLKVKYLLKHFCLLFCPIIYLDWEQNSPRYECLVLPVC